MARFVIIGEVSDQRGNKKRWRGLYENTESLQKIAERASVKEPHEQAFAGDKWDRFTIHKVMREEEYRK